MNSDYNPLNSTTSCPVGMPGLDLNISGTQPSMLEYLVYLKIDNKDEVIYFLTKKSLLTLKIFKSALLSSKEVRGVGLSLEVVTLIFDCVHCFGKYIGWDNFLA